MGSTTQPDLCEACTGTGLKNPATLCPECRGTASRKERARLAGIDVEPKPAKVAGKTTEPTGDDGSGEAKESGDSEDEGSEEDSVPAK